MHSIHMWCVTIVFALIISVEAALSNMTDTANTSTAKECPPWSKRDIATGTCRCVSKKFLRCFWHNGTIEASLPYCYCLAYNDRFNKTVIGRCIVRCHVPLSNPSRQDPTKCTTRSYSILNKTNDISKMNHAYCRDLEMNRTGQLCGSCLEGYTPPVYSYDMACVECSDYKYNWLRYIAIAYLPLTVFCVIIIVFRINVTSGSINSYIMSIQIITAPSILRWINVSVITNSGNTFATRLLAKLLLTLYSFWNLDFFRLIYKPFCLHPGMTMLETLVLDYAIAVYPLLLVIITYLLVELHDRSLIVRKVWKPFYMCLTRFRNTWNIKSSLIGAFATFILLSYVKILNVSLDLLTAVTVHELNGEQIQQLYLAADATIEFFGIQHLPYALLALFMLLLFNVFPLVLLCVYPCRCFQRCIKHFRLHSHTLHTFIEVFQGSFKTYPRDFRYFSAYYFILRIVNLLLIVLFGSTDFKLQFSLQIIVLSFATLLLAITKPHKSKLHSNIDIAVIVWLSLIASFSTSSDLVYKMSYHALKRIYNTVFSVIFVFHSLYGIVVLLSVFISGQKIKAVFTKICEMCLRSSTPRSDDDQLPYRLEYNSEHTPLLYKTN